MRRRWRFSLPLLISLLVVGVLAFTNWRSPIELSPQVLAQETKQVVEDLKAQEKDIFEVIDSNIKALRALEQRIQVEPSPQAYDQFVEELQKITESFEGIAQDEAGIEKALLNKQQSLRRLTQDAQSEIAKLREKLASYQKELSRAALESDPEVMEAKKRGFSQAIKYVQKEIEIWERFLTTQKAIVGEAQKIDQRVRKFLAIIEINAIVYREALNLLELQQDIRKAVELLGAIPELERLAKEMVESWNTLDSLVEELLSLGGTR